MMPGFFHSLLKVPRDAVEVTFGVDPWSGLGLAAGAAGIMAGSVVVGVFLYKISEWLTGDSSSERWVLNRATRRYKETSRKRSKNVIRLIFSCLAILTVIFGFYIAFSIVGVNFWTIMLAGGIVTWLGNSAFSQPLGSAGAFLLIAFSDKFEEGWYLRIRQYGIEGRVKSIHVLWCDLDYYDEETASWVEIQVPTIVLLIAVVERVFQKERSAPQHELNPNLKNGKIKKGNHQV